MGVAKVVIRENGTYWKLADVVQLWGKPAERSDVVRKESIRKGSVVDDQLGVCVGPYFFVTVARFCSARGRPLG